MWWWGGGGGGGTGSFGFGRKWFGREGKKKDIGSHAAATVCVRGLRLWLGGMIVRGLRLLVGCMIAKTDCFHLQHCAGAMMEKLAEMLRGQPGRRRGGGGVGVSARCFFW